MDKVKELWNKLPKPLKDSFKEGGRIILIGLVSWFLTEGVVDGFIGWCCNNFLSADGKAWAVSTIFIALKSLDKWLHVYGKESGKEGLVTGLTRF